MKKNILIGAIALVAVALMGGSYICYLNQTTASFIVRYDITDNRKQNIDTSELPCHIALVSGKWSETTVAFSTFSNFRENASTTVAIPAEFPLLSNPNQRTQKLKVAYSKILDSINSLVAKNTGRELSIIYEPMAKDLNTLAATSTHTREAIFYTDAQENNPRTLSMYQQEDIDLVTTNPKRVKALFEKEVPLGKLNGITVYLIYNAPTPYDESHFLVMATLWKELFEAHGASVIIATNLTN